jgi:arylsulfatase A-like enzyme
MFADRAIEFLKSNSAEKPFFAYVAFTSPHDPRQPPDRFREFYSKNRPPLPTNFLPQHPFDNGMMNGGRDENLAAWPRTEAVIRDQLGEYYGMVSHLDEQIGRVLDTLEQRGLADRTLVIYAADNGLALGSHGLVGKQSLYEHSTLVPLVIKGPNVKKGNETKAFTYLFDVFPTICDLLSIEKPSDLDGKSLVPLLRDPSAKIRESVFLPFTKHQRSIRDEDWKLICYPQISHKQLFHLKTDPHEMLNLATLPESLPVIQRLETMMAGAQALYGDTLTIPSENKPFVPIDLSNKPRQPDKWQPEWIVNKYFQQ